MSRKGSNGNSGFVAMNDMDYYSVKNEDTYGINRQKKKKKFKKQLLTDKAVRRTHVILNHTKKNALAASSMRKKQQESSSSGALTTPHSMQTLFESFLHYLSTNPTLRPLISLIVKKNAPDQANSSTVPNPLGHLSNYGYTVPRM